MMHHFFTYSPRQHHFEYKWYNFELLRLLGSAPYGGCDAAEFLETVARLKPNDAGSWQEEWLAIAERTETLAEEMAKTGHTAAARGAYLRASNYLRCAQYMFPSVPKSEQAYMLELYNRSIADFEKAAKLMTHQVRRVHIPLDSASSDWNGHANGGLVNGRQGLKLPGWLHIPAPSQRLVDRKTPVLICFGGADSTQEELYFLSVADGPALGYAVLTFDGPGQGLVLRRDGIPLRPDGETIVGAVLDFLGKYSEQNPEANLDLDALTITGQSLGAYLALRGAADPRIKACIAVDPIYDLWELAMSRMPGWVVWMWENGVLGDGFIDWVATTHGKFDVAVRYMFAQAQGMLGSPSPAQTLRDMKPFSFRLDRTVARPAKYNLSGDYLERIRCPVLITGAAADPSMFMADLTTNKVMAGLISVEAGQTELWMPKTYSEGGAQAKSGAWQMLQYKTFRFLDEKLCISRVPEQT